jgi:hypothetical protein
VSVSRERGDAGEVRTVEWPIATAATMNGSDVACSNAAATVLRVPSRER